MGESNSIQRLQIPRSPQGDNVLLLNRGSLQDVSPRYHLTATNTGRLYYAPMPALISHHNSDGSCLNIWVLFQEGSLFVAYVVCFRLHIFIEGGKKRANQLTYMVVMSKTNGMDLRETEHVSRAKIGSKSLDKSPKKRQGFARVKRCGGSI